MSEEVVLRRYWLALTRLRAPEKAEKAEKDKGGAQRAPGASGARVPRRAVQEAALRFGAKALFEAPSAEIRAELRPSLLRLLASFDDWEWVDAEMERAREAGAAIIPLEDEVYPPRLREIPDPPLVLYAKGDVTLASMDNSLAIVGTRRPTHYGLRMAERLAADMASLGTVIISGMARGCDMAAHRGALMAGGATVAVLGTGVDRCYPAEAERLYEEICAKGLVLSEFPMGAEPLSHNFPRRNRIISGLSRGVLIVEAPRRSGAMMTTRLALEQNRDVFAVPGPVTSYKSQGPNSLIKQGALLVEEAGDILASWGLGTAADKERDRGGGQPQPAGRDEALVFKALEGGPLSIDEIAEDTGIGPKDLGGLLLEMELKGLLTQRPGKVFTRKF